MLHRVYGPLTTYLGSKIPGVRFRLEAAKDYEAFEQRLAAGAVDFALTNPYQTIQAVDRNYVVFAKETDDDAFRGIILIRRDSGIAELEDLVGKTISYPAPTAVAATMMVQYFFQTHGLPVRRTRSLFVGSQESSMSSVYLRASQAGGTWPSPWVLFGRENHKIGQALEVKWRIDSLVNNGIVAQKSVPPDVVNKVGEAFSRSRRSATRAKLVAEPLMSIPGFEAATPQTS